MAKSKQRDVQAGLSAEELAEIKALPLEKCFEDLDKIVQSLENQTVSLEQSIALFERGMALSKRCSSELTRIEKRIQLIMENDKGEPVYEDFPSENGEGAED